MSSMNKAKLKLDPAVEKQLRAPSGHDAEVQRLLDNPREISVFMDFRVDYAFKYILGHKEILLKLLNDTLPLRVDNIEYLPNEIPVISEKEKRSVFDVICTNNETGQKFLCEMQHYPDSDMDDRLLYYGCSLIQKQVKRGSEDYNLNSVYVICIADYLRSHTVLVPENEFFFRYSFIEHNNLADNLTPKLQFYFLELPRLRKVWESAETNIERWCYLFENLHNFVNTPQEASGFESVFEVARIGGLDQDQQKDYLNAMLTDYDRHVIGKFNREEGFKEGKEEGREEGREEGALLKAKQIATTLKAEGIAVDIIIRSTGLSPEQIQDL